MLLGKLDICLQKTETTRLSPYKSINSKQTKDLNIRPETLKLEQERAGNTLETIGIDNDLLSRIQMAQQLRERIDKWDYMKLKSFCITKEMVSKLNSCPQNGRKSLPAIHQTRE
jgi:hypothetical protein